MVILLPLLVVILLLLPVVAETLLLLPVVVILLLNNSSLLVAVADSSSLLFLPVVYSRATLLLVVVMLLLNSSLWVVREAIYLARLSLFSLNKCEDRLPKLEVVLFPRLSMLRLSLLVRPNRKVWINSYFLLGLFEYRRVIHLVGLPIHVNQILLAAGSNHKTHNLFSS